ncbi:MAG: glutamyl-tRNA reductase [Sediminibacterium sp.]|jgi:glutamyl-tRNA reductase|nr:glutamyl-tRNA reductase [Chitinophagaceae bacterium]MCA6445861.1 glutamyl-tRNA reductase [Chitinophagaceae bacterium]
MEKLEQGLLVVGVNYRKTSLEIRSKFAFTTELLRSVYQEQISQDNRNFFILSTCNRTEVYGVNISPTKYFEILKKYTTASEEDIKTFTFVKQGDEAMHHLFRVSSGLDSQILGDYEIIGQLKNAFSLAKTCGCADGYLEKLVNSALQASRQVRNRTSISDGTTSVSYAVIQQLKQFFGDTEPQNVCLLGMGKFGELTLKNLQHYLPQHKLVVLNRNELRAKEISENYKVPYDAIENIDRVIGNADILVVATSADHPLITKEQIENSSVKVVFDLSVPSNVSADAKLLDGVTFFDIDSLSVIVNETIAKRTNQVPLALTIIDEHIATFRQWETRRLLYTSTVEPKVLPNIVFN